MIGDINDFFANNSVLELCVPKRVWDFHTATDLKKYADESGAKKNKKRILFVLFGAIIGAINGLFGAGGGMLAVPVLSFVAQLDQRKSHATAILVMLPLCLASATIYLASNKIDFAVLIPSCIGVFLGGILGAKLLKFMPENLLFLMFNLLVLIAGFKMLF